MKDLKQSRNHYFKQSNATGMTQPSTNYQVSHVKYYKRPEPSKKQERFSPKLVQFPDNCSFMIISNASNECIDAGHAFANFSNKRASLYTWLTTTPVKENGHHEISQQWIAKRIHKKSKRNEFTIHSAVDPDLCWTRGSLSNPCQGGAYKLELSPYQVGNEDQIFCCDSVGCITLKPKCNIGNITEWALE